MDILEQCFDAAFSAPDGISKLRMLILNLAMQGKLVPQDSNDPSASELQKEIAVDKQRLVNEGKTKESKNLQEIKPEEMPYRLPKGWEWVTLDEITERIHYGYTASADPDNRETLLLRITDIQDNKIDWLTVPGCKIETADIQKFSINPGDILVARTGSIGKSYLVGDVPKPTVFASYLIRIVPISLLLPKYIKIFLESPCFWDQLTSRSFGTGQQNVNATRLRSLLIPLAPFKEQKRIVAKVDQLMARCDELEKLHAEWEHKRLAAHASALNHLLTAAESEDFREAWQFICQNFGEFYSVKGTVVELRRVVTQLAAMGKLVRQSPSDPPANELLKEIETEKQRLTKEGKSKASKMPSKIKQEEVPCILPKGWEWVRLASLAISIDYGTSIKTCDDSSKVPVYRMGNIVDGQLVDNDMKYIDSSIDDLPRLYLRKDDILFNRTNSYELIGKSAIYLGPDDVATFASYLIRVRLVDGYLFPAFICMAMNAPCFRKTQIEPNFVQQCGQANFNGTKLSATLLPVPPLAEQRRIMTRIDHLMALCAELEEKIDTANSKQAAVLSAVMSMV